MGRGFLNQGDKDLWLPQPMSGVSTSTELSSSQQKIKKKVQLQYQSIQK